MRFPRILAAAAVVVATAALASQTPGSEPAAAQGPLPYRLVLGGVVRDGGNPTRQDEFQTSASVSSDGGEIVVRARVRAERAETVVLDIETYDAIGRRIDQQWVDNLALAAGQERETVIRFTPPANATGPLYVKVGVFQPGPYWGLLYHWNNEAATFPYP